MFAWLKSWFYKDYEKKLAEAKELLEISELARTIVTDTYDLLVCALLLKFTDNCEVKIERPVIDSATALVPQYRISDNRDFTIVLKIKDGQKSQHDNSN